MSIAIKNQLILILETLKRATKIVSTSNITLIAYKNDANVAYKNNVRENITVSIKFISFLIVEIILRYQHVIIKMI